MIEEEFGSRFGDLRAAFFSLHYTPDWLDDHFPKHFAKAQVAKGIPGRKDLATT